MKISFILPAINLSGGTKIVLEYADFLQGKGHQVACIVPAPRRPPLKDFIRNFMKAKSRPTFDEVGHLTGKDVEIISSRHSGPACATDIPDGDLVIATWWRTAEWITPLPPRKGVKCYFVQGYEIFPHLPVARVKATYNQGLNIITVSRWLKDVLEREHDARDIALVSNGVNYEDFGPNNSLCYENKFIGHVWSNNPLKNSSLSLESLKIARRSLPTLRGIFFGEGPLPEELKGYDWITYYSKPAQDDIKTLYSKCTAWLFTSISEGFGLPILEAMASGTPVIATHAGAAPDLINESNGMLIGTTASEMADAIIQVVSFPYEVWETMSREARQTAEKHSRSRSSENFESALTRIYERSR